MATGPGSGGTPPARAPLVFGLISSYFPSSGGCCPEQAIENPASRDMDDPIATVFQDCGLCASRLFQGISEDREVSEAAFCIKPLRETSQGWISSGQAG